MKENDYSLAQKRVKLAILIVKFAQEVWKLLSMAFNYHSSEYNRNAFS